jgi:hypothetical protein
LRRSSACCLHDEAPVRRVLKRAATAPTRHHDRQRAAWTKNSVTLVEERAEHVLAEKAITSPRADLDDVARLDLTRRYVLDEVRRVQFIGRRIR